MRRAWLIAASLTALLGTVVACSAPTPVTFPEGPGDVVSEEAPDVVGPLRLRGRDLVDASGRVVQIHGTNMVRKTAPSYVEVGGPLLNDANLARLRRDGINAVRLGIRPDALMPQPGVLDDAYLEQVAEGVELITSRQMWVLLDLHQDVFDGMPAWATTPEAAALPTFPPELTQGAAWALQYISPRSTRQWEDWWNQVPVAQGRSGVELYGDGLVAVAQRFSANPSVIGIDLMNEPFAGERFFDCLAGACAARYQQVDAVFTAWSARIHAVAPDMVAWWEPFTFAPPFQGTAPPGPGVGFTFHSYCLGTDGGEATQPSPIEHAICQPLYEGAVSDAVGLSQRWSTPAILGEFGASNSPLNSTRLTQLADEQLLSWFYWHCCDAPEIVRTDLVRTYAQATAGQPLLQRYDPASGDFELRYRPDHGIDAPTSVAVPSDAYPNGYTATVTGGSVTSPANSGRLTVEPDAGATEVVVRVTRSDG